MSRYRLIKESCYLIRTKKQIKIVKEDYKIQGLLAEHKELEMKQFDSLQAFGDWVHHFGCRRCDDIYNSLVLGYYYKMYGCNISMIIGNNHKITILLKNGLSRGERVQKLYRVFLAENKEYNDKRVFMHLQLYKRNRAKCTQITQSFLDGIYYDQAELAYMLDNNIVENYNKQKDATK